MTLVIFREQEEHTVAAAATKLSVRLRRVSSVRRPLAYEKSGSVVNVKLPVVVENIEEEVEEAVAVALSVGTNNSTALAVTVTERDGEVASDDAD